MADRDLVKKAILGSMIGTIGGGMVGERLGRMTGYNFAGPVGGALLGGYVGEKMMEPKKRREPKEALDLLRDSLAKRSSLGAEARSMLKEAVDPLLLAAIAAGGVSGSMIGRKIGFALRGTAFGKRLSRILKGASSILKSSSSNAESEVPVPANLEEPSDRDKQLEANKRVLRKAVSKFAPLYKTKGAKGWDVLAESIATDDQAPGGS